MGMEAEQPAFRFLHTADLHLDSPFGGLAEAAPPAVAALVRRATLDTWRRIVELALAEGVDFVVIAGDVFDSEERTLRGQLAFTDGLRLLDGAGIPSFVVTGNHDPLSGWEPSIALPERAHRFGAERVEARPVLRDGVEIARVYGISYGIRDVSENLALRFRKEPGSPFAIGLLHANVGGQPGHANYAPCSLADLASTGIDYWALGHVHRPQVLRDQAPTVVYAGNPQGRDVGEAAPRGAMLVDVDHRRQARVELRELDEIRWVVRAVDIADLPDLDALLARLEQELEGARSAAGRAVIARLELIGYGRLHAELRHPDTVRDLRERLADRFAAQTPFVWPADLRDATRPEEARALERAGDFLGELEIVTRLALGLAEREGGAGAEPALGAEPAALGEPGAGAEPALGAEPTALGEPGLGAELTLGAEPAAGAEPTACGAPPLPHPAEGVVPDPASLASELFASSQVRLALRTLPDAGAAPRQLDRLRQMDEPTRADLLRRARARILDELASRE